MVPRTFFFAAKRPGIPLGQAHHKVHQQLADTIDAGSCPRDRIKIISFPQYKFRWQNV